MKKALFFLLLIVLAGVVLMAFPMSSVLSALLFPVPPHAFHIEDKSIIYTISYDRAFGDYTIWPSDKQKGDYRNESYISSSSAPLEQFLNKKVRIIGKFVWTKRTLTYPGYPNKAWHDPVGAVEITHIAFTKE